MTLTRPDDHRFPERHPRQLHLVGEQLVDNTAFPDGKSFGLPPLRLSVPGTFAPIRERGL
jgi:hypothetical protein